MGYYSRLLYSHFYHYGVHALFRLKKDANKTVKKFYNSSKINLKSYIISENKFIPIRYFKYFIDGNKYILGTTMRDASIEKLQKMYILRWGVETSYKRIKSYQNINKIYSRTPKLWLQELQLRILYDTLLIRTQDNYRKIKNFNRNISYGKSFNNILFLGIIYY